MMLATITAAAIYASELAADATYRDASGAALPVRVILETGPDTQLAAAEVGVRGQARAYRVQQSELVAPAVGETLEHAGVHYRVDAFESITYDAEWRLYVCT